ncbi:hypothetical protein SM11_chr2977 [Sinorhizobium meliloti SM11]|uniref:Uncharacterized protein n=1 Tax=Sinorhizobium meliloti (strain SM11) TaxID=707241 RepID=F7X8W2_SINMM|nr:hypothetical protein SM11_chr2977 [Sinorhizobium meliloti SM11]
MNPAIPGITRPARSCRMALFARRQAGALSSHDPDQVANEARPRQALMSATILTPRNNDRMKSGETPSRSTPAAAFHGASGDCSGP